MNDNEPMTKFSSQGSKEHESPNRQQDRLPPGQILSKNFPVLHYGSIPPFNAATWTFQIWGEVEQPLTLSWDAFNKLPKTKIKMDIHCVTTWSLFDTEWEGVSLRTLIDLGLLIPKASANYVIQHAESGFTTNLPLEIMMADNFLLATGYDGKPLTPSHGFPLRGVIGAFPNRRDLKDVYLWKGAKWLRGLEFLPNDRLGFWERAGYNNTADVWLEQRYA